MKGKIGLMKLPVQNQVIVNHSCTCKGFRHLSLGFSAFKKNHFLLFCTWFCGFVHFCIYFITIIRLCNHFDFERKWWRFFHGLILRTKLEIYVFITFIFYDQQDIYLFLRRNGRLKSISFLSLIHKTYA